MYDIWIFNVELGQCAFVYPRLQPQYGMLVDVGTSEEFNPVEFLIQNNLIYHDGNEHVLGNLLLTNYDHDHFAGLPDLVEQARIKTVRFAKNLTAGEIISLKEEKTEALDRLSMIKETYIQDAVDHFPPYKVTTFHLEKSDIVGEIDTNQLSQVAFVQIGTKTICFPGDLTKLAWDILLKNPGFCLQLSNVDILIAPHHGREDGYNPDVFSFCAPECIIISDKSIVHETQEGMSSIYGNHVKGDGVILNNDTLNKKKVLTTRRHGHILLKVNEVGVSYWSSNE